MTVGNGVRCLYFTHLPMYVLSLSDFAVQLCDFVIDAGV